MASDAPDPYDAHDPVFAKLRAICLGLPDTSEVQAWGHPTFRVGVGKALKIFCACGADGSTRSLSFKCEPDVQHALVASDPRFTIAAYVGKHGWVSMDVAQRKSWDEVAALIRESYQLIAPKASLAKLRDA